MIDGEGIAKILFFFSCYQSATLLGFWHLLFHFPVQRYNRTCNLTLYIDIKVDRNKPLLRFIIITIITIFFFFFKKGRDDGDT